jgi:hypothetical protein
MTRTMSRREALVILGAAAAVLACGRAPRELQPGLIAVGRDQCAFCRMVIDDAGLAVQVVEPDGRVTPFGEVGCLLAWSAQRADLAGTAFVMATDTRRWLSAPTARYALGAVRTPMLYNLSAYERVPDGIAPDAIFDWDSLRRKGAPDAQPA